MRIIYLTAFLIFISSCTKSQRVYLGAKSTKPSIANPHALIIFSGESNSGGYALNSGALSGELGDRPSVQILNNTSLNRFETLHISTIGDGLSNTHVGHSGAEGWGARHGWELGLANAADSGTLPSTVYLVKTGQGGSGINDWLGNGSYLTTVLFPRVDAAKSIMTAMNNNVAPPMYLFYSQGINNIIAGMSAATWKANTKTHFAAIRARYGTIPIFMTLFGGAYTSYNTVISEIASEISDCYAIPVSDAELSDAHWTYLGMKLISARMITTLKAHYTYY